MGQTGRVCRRWFERGLRHQAVYLFGAVCPERDAGVALLLPAVSAAAMQAMLDELSQAVKTAVHGEGRTANIPYALTLYQPTVGGRGETYLEIHPRTAGERGIRNGDRVRVISDLGEIETFARFYPPSHPEIVVLPFGLGHWAWGRWARNRRTGNSCEILPNVSDPISRLAGFYTVKVRVEKA